MSLRRGYRSQGNWNQEARSFEFEDEFGQDPVLSRYGNTDAARQLSKARIAQSASEVELARASLNAVTEPVKQMADFFQNMNSAVKQQQDLYRTGRVNAQAAMLLPELEKAQSYADINALAANPQFTDALQQPENLARLNAKLEGARFRDVAVLKTRLPKAMGQQEVDDLFNEYSHLAGDDEVVKLFNTFTPIARRRETAMKGLMEAGAQAMPVTPTGELDVDRAERALAGTYTSQDVRSLQGTASNLTRQLDNIDDPESPEAASLQEQLNAVNRQLGTAAMQQESGALRAQAEGQSLGIGQKKGWQTSIIYGEPPAEKPEQSDAPAAESETAPASNAKSAAAEETTKSEPKSRSTESYKPENRREIGKLELELQRAREKAGLTDQPAGVRTINEALAAQNAPVREKAAAVEEARERINPYEEADTDDAQTIQNALSIVYPRLENGGFDVGDANDSRVVSAAEFLQRVDPSLLRRIASSPSRTGSRAGLSLEEITDLAARARPSARGRKVSN